MRFAQFWIVCSFAFAFNILQADKRFAQSSVNVAQRVIKNHPASEFTGEWTFRWAMRKGGWEIAKENTPTLLAQPVESVPGPRPESFRLQDVYSDGTGGFRLIGTAQSIGYYGETLGFWPIGCDEGFQEEVKVWAQ